MGSQITPHQRAALFIHTEGETSKMSTRCWFQDEPHTATSVVSRQSTQPDFGSTLFPKETHRDSHIQPGNKKIKNSILLLRGFLLVRRARKLGLDIKNVIMKYVNFHMDSHDSPRSY